MRAFFYGWKRKVGAVTLALALAFLAGWIRSDYHRDRISVQATANTFIVITSFNSDLAWLRLVPTSDTIKDQERLDRYHADGRQFAEKVLYLLLKNEKSQWRNVGCGLSRFTEEYDHKFFDVHQTAWKIRYWAIVVPLTLLSRCFFSEYRDPRNHENHLDGTQEFQIKTRTAEMAFRLRSASKVVTGVTFPPGLPRRCSRSGF